MTKSQMGEEDRRAARGEFIVNTFLVALKARPDIKDFSKAIGEYDFTAHTKITVYIRWSS